MDLLPFVDDNDDSLLFVPLNHENTESTSTYDPNWQRFRLDELTDVQAKSYFRSKKDDIQLLAHHLGIPDRFILKNRCRVSGIEGLCILLRRLTYPNSFCDLERFFGRPISTLSFGVKAVLNFLYDNHHHRLTTFDQPWFVTRLREYAHRISEKGSTLNNLFGFVDGTVRPLCRPTRFQRIVYNGHKRIHALKF